MTIASSCSIFAARRYAQLCSLSEAVDSIDRTKIIVFLVSFRFVVVVVCGAVCASTAPFFVWMRCAFYTEAGYRLLLL